ncbi:MAG TPA: rhomboid family intramembrane serine protease [Candidatus Polarisedimenticolaceae bacterium]
MSYYRNPPFRGSGVQLGLPPITPVNRALMIACGAVWAVQFVSAVFFRSAWPDLLFGLNPADVLSGWVWQPLTYVFLHSTAYPTHLLFNLLVLWMFGGELERYMGGRRYLTYFLICGGGAGLFVVGQALLRGGAALDSITIGASGVVYGLILAYGVLFAERIVLVMFVFPMKARTMMWIFFAMAFLSNLSQSPDGISHIAHLGGMVVGWVYLKKAWRLGEIAREIRWKLRRRKFKVMPPGDDRWIH